MTHTPHESFAQLEAAIADELSVRSNWGTADDTDVAGDSGDALSNGVDAVIIEPLVSAADLKNVIEAAFVQNARVEGRNLGVTADANGVVTLEGHVHTRAECDQAERLAWSAPGVTSVHNCLNIQL